MLVIFLAILSFSETGQTVKVVVCVSMREVLKLLFLFEGKKKALKRFGCSYIWVCTHLL